jgi:hypothetical protein
VHVGQTVTIRKVDYVTGHPVLSWPGTVVACTTGLVAVRAQFLPRGGGPVFVDGVPFEAGDTFTEYYYRNCWFNVFHIASVDGQHKGWYCNVTRPPVLDADAITYVDLSLDLFVHPDWHCTVLDEDEFALAAVDAYTPEEVEQAWTALRELISMAEGHELPAPET